MSSRLMRHLVWTPVGEPRGGKLSLLAGVAPESRSEDLHLDTSLGARDTAIYLLHIGAEIEHLLMVQYLYAGYSVGGPHLTDEQNRIAAVWRKAVLTIALEEMAHLATVQNLLTLVGGPVTFEREDFPVPSELYPFPFALEPLTKHSLAKYVLAEMPNEQTLKSLGLTDEIKKIEESLDGGIEAVKVHRVGIVYDTLNKLFAMPDQPKDPAAKLPPFVPSRDISAASLAFQVRPEEWGLDQPDLLIKTAVDRSSAGDAITAISVQGEGSTIADLPGSHFGRFLEIYRAFPDNWSPAKPIATNPKLCRDDEGDLITDPTARLWADLFNLRYRLLLMMLSHSFHIQSNSQGAAQSPRGLLISWTFGEMYHLRSIADILMTLPLGPEAGGKFAGPPFLMPYSLALPVHDRNRWRGHRDLIHGSDALARELLLQASARTRTYLEGLLAANQRAILQIEPLIGD
jgi:hypothetical protein